MKGKSHVKKSFSFKIYSVLKEENEKPPKKNKKTNKTQKNPLGWAFLKKTRVFSHPALKPPEAWDQ